MFPYLCMYLYALCLLPYRMQLKVLSRYERSTTIFGLCNNNDYFSMRRMVCEFILYFRTYMNR